MIGADSQPDHKEKCPLDAGIAVFCAKSLLGINVNDPPFDL
jgi:hypothetical protein